MKQQQEEEEEKESAPNPLLDQLRARKLQMEDIDVVDTPSRARAAAIAPVHLVHGIYCSIIHSTSALSHMHTLTCSLRARERQMEDIDVWTHLYMRELLPLPQCILCGHFHTQTH